MDGTSDELCVFRLARGLATRLNTGGASASAGIEPPHPLAVLKPRAIAVGLIGEAGGRDHGNAQRCARKFERDRASLRPSEAQHGGGQATRIKAMRLGGGTIEDRGVAGRLAPFAPALLQPTAERPRVLQAFERGSQALDALGELGRIAAEERAYVRELGVVIRGLRRHRNQVLDRARELLRVNERQPAAHRKAVARDRETTPARS